MTKLELSSVISLLPLAQDPFISLPLLFFISWCWSNVTLPKVAAPTIDPMWSSTPCRCALLALVLLTFSSRPARYSAAHVQLANAAAMHEPLPPIHRRFLGLLFLFPNKYQPFFHKNPVVSLDILSDSLLGSLLLILLFGSPSSHLLVSLLLLLLVYFLTPS